MANAHDQDKWAQILATLEDKLQFGFLEQARAVADVRFNGGEVTLLVSSEEALEFFRADVNQQRLMIVSRPVIRINSIIVEKIEAEPIN
jgi:hypothetical protein